MSDFWTSIFLKQKIISKVIFELLFLVELRNILSLTTFRKIRWISFKLKGFNKNKV